MAHDPEDLWTKGFGKRTRMREEATLDDYWRAPGGDVDVGGLSRDWSDKPHRLLYDLIGEVLHLRAELAEQIHANTEMKEQVRVMQGRLTQLSWKGEVDRQGGSFTDDEIQNATGWR